jgi:hypothetical protein
MSVTLSTATLAESARVWRDGQILAVGLVDDAG